MPSYSKPYEYGYDQQEMNIQYGNGQNMGGYSSGEGHDDIGGRLEKLMSVKNAHIWYAAFLPLFGLFFEMFAASRYLGYFLWGLIIAMRILVCRYDSTKIAQLGLWGGSEPSWQVFFPVIYIIKRSGQLGRSHMPVGMAVGCIVLALINNGFTASLTYNENNYYEFVSTYGAGYINNLPEDEFWAYNPYTTIDGLLNSFCVDTNGTISGDMFIKYEYENNGGKHYVTARGTKGGDELTIVFLVDYDGYYYDGVDIVEVTLGGETLEGDKKDALLKEIFMLEYEHEAEEDI